MCLCRVHTAHAERDDRRTVIGSDNGLRFTCGSAHSPTHIGDCSGCADCTHCTIGTAVVKRKHSICSRAGLLSSASRRYVCVPFETFAFPICIASQARTMTPKLCALVNYICPRNRFACHITHKTNSPLGESNKRSDELAQLGTD